jgi:uncharacterized OB-fold protein
MTVAPVRRDADTAQFLDGTSLGEFRLRRCPDGHWSEPAAQVCSTCGSVDLDWAAASGLGTLISWVVTHGRADAGRPPPLAVLAIVELDEGPWWWTRVEGIEPDAVTAGMRLRAHFERADDEHEAVPVFSPA